MSSMKITRRPSEERGNSEYGWLKSFHTFSIAPEDYKHVQHGPLRVLNEDRVASGTGFGTHSHREFEIFSYVVSGELEHKDSMGNTEILKRGSLQMTSAGTGISHSERAHGSEEVHFLQIWSIPHTRRLAPKYFTREFSDAQKTNTWLCTVAPAVAEGVSLERDGEGPAPVQSALTMYATLLEKGRSVEKTLSGKKGYVQVIQTGGYNTGKAGGAAVRVSGVGDGKQEAVLKEGDSTYLDVGDHEGHGAELIIENVGDTTAEVLLFDLE